MERSKEDHSVFVLSTGTEIYANCQIIGIAPDLQISGGYDGSIPGEEKLTAAEKIEIADYMIALWQKYREAQK